MIDRHMDSGVLSTACVALATLGSCGFAKPVDLVDAAPPVRTDVVVVPAVPNPNVDLLFVIANTPTMGATQAGITSAFPQFLAQLNAEDGGLPNLHLGVVTSDMGTSAATGSAAASVGSGAGRCAGAGDAGRLHYGGSGVTGLYLSDIADSSGNRPPGT